MVKRRNEQEVMSRPEPFAWKGAYDASSNLIYEGWAVPGSATSAAVWLIAKYDYDGSNNLTTTTWAYTSGFPAGEFNQVWDNYLTLTYV